MIERKTVTRIQRVCSWSLKDHLELVQTVSSIHYFLVFLFRKCVPDLVSMMTAQHDNKSVKHF